MVTWVANRLSDRTAGATGAVRTTAEVIGLLLENGLPKGDALAAARIAGIMSAKRTADLVPLCHPITLAGVVVELEPQDAQVRIHATVRSTGPTGVEMEALTAVAVVGLTVRDVIKTVDPSAALDCVRLERKLGGKSGEWRRPPDPLSSGLQRAPARRCPRQRRRDDPSVRPSLLGAYPGTADTWVGGGSGALVPLLASVPTRVSIGGAWVDPASGRTFDVTDPNALGRGARLVIGGAPADGPGTHFNARCRPTPSPQSPAH
jgi:cyclic pyranopterin phosphate synthase